MQRTLKEKNYHHLEGLYPLIPPKLLEDEAIFRALLSWIHPEFMIMVTKEGFNASRISKEELTKIENATRENGKLELEYQVDLSELPKRHCGKALNHQEDASRVGPSCAAAYLKGHTATWGGYKKDASSYLAENKDPNCKLAQFLRKSLEHYENLGLSDDDFISCLYPGTTSRPCLVRWAEHDSVSSTSLNSLFFREFEKTIQFPVMCVLSGNIAMSLVCESFVASLLQLSTLATLRKSDPNASFLFQADDGSALTRTGAGVNLQHRQDVLSFVTQFHGPRDDTPLSKISLPKSMKICLQNNEGRILDYCGGDNFVKKYGEVISTLDDLTVEQFHSYVSSFAHSRAVANIAKQMGISLEEASSELGRRAIAGAVASIAAKENTSLKEASSELGRRGRDGAVASIAKQMGISLKEASSEFARRGITDEQRKEWGRGAGRSSSGMDTAAINSLAESVQEASNTAETFDTKVSAISLVTEIADIRNDPSIRWHFCKQRDATFSSKIMGSWTEAPQRFYVKVVPESSSRNLQRAFSATMDVMRDNHDFQIQPWRAIESALVNMLGGDPPVYGGNMGKNVVPGTTIKLTDLELKRIAEFKEYAQKHRVGKQKIKLTPSRPNRKMYDFIKNKANCIGRGQSTNEIAKIKNRHVLNTIKEMGYDLGNFDPDKHRNFV